MRRGDVCERSPRCCPSQHCCSPRRPDGAAPDYKGTPYQDAIDAGAFDDGIVALLRKRKGRWQVVQYVVGATDVPYVDWDKKYRAPSAIFADDGQ